jgi:hypothetical protein
MSEFTGGASGGCPATLRQPTGRPLYSASKGTAPSLTLAMAADHGGMDGLQPRPGNQSLKEQK